MPASFADLGVPADLIATLAVRSISEPFPIQTLTLPDALAGRDVCGRAPTGSGKTLAFGLAAVARLDRRAKPRRPLALVLTPTRELCAQVAAELAPLAAARGRRVASFYGGVGYGPQTRALKAGVDIAVACPGRLADLASTGAISLHDVGVVVVDEADRMADMGFLPEVRRLLDQTRPDRQTMLFSATLDGDVDVLVRHYQRDPVRHVLDNDEAGAARAEHVFWRVEGPSRIGLAAAIVAARGATMVFCRTKHGTDRAAKQLTAKGVRAAAIHGDRSQAQRERALAAFAAGHVDVLVATDVAARGIHVDGVEAIVHFDPPTDAKDYLHRSGRTARAGASGLIVSFVTDEKSKAVMRMQRDLSFPVGAGAPDLASLATTKPRRRVPSTSPAPPARPDRPQRPTPPARGERAKRRARAERLSQPERAAPPAQRAGATQPEPVSRPGQPAGSGPRPVTDVGQRRRRRHTGKPVPGRSGRARRAG